MFKMMKSHLRLTQQSLARRLRERRRARQSRPRASRLPRNLSHDIDIKCIIGAMFSQRYLRRFIPSNAEWSLLWLAGPFTFEVDNWLQPTMQCWEYTNLEFQVLHFVQPTILVAKVIGVYDSKAARFCGGKPMCETTWLTSQTLMSDERPDWEKYLLREYWIVLQEYNRL